MGNNIVIFGSSGHSRVIIDIIEKENKYSISGLLDDKFESPGTVFFGYELLGNISSLRDVIKEKDIHGGIIAIGDNWIRFKVMEKILAMVPDFNFITTIHPSAVLARNVTIGKGTAVMAGAVINSDSKIGDFTIINTSSSVDHDNIIEDFASIAPGVTTGGNVNVGKYGAVSLKAGIIHGITIGEHTVIGAGSVVLKDIPPFSVAYGVPAKIIRERKKGERYL